jgi:RNA polymerase sigma factor (sigma-70 family)
VKLMTTSQQLLLDYAKSDSETAFRELVTRYIDLVFSTAIRLVGGDAHLAEDVAQTVFIDLARHASRLSADTMLGGWLHRDTCFVAAKLMRGERRRQFRESQATEMNALNAAETKFTELAPVLDQAINELAEEDRKAILLRFYEQYDLRSVGEALGSSENAAQKRVTRAPDQLRSLLIRRGVVLSTAVLGTTLAGEAVTAAPTGLAASIVGIAIAGAAKTGTMATLSKALLLTKAKLAVFGAVFVGVVAMPLVIQHQAQVRLLAKNRSLQEQLDQIGQLTVENARLSNLLAHASNEPSFAEERMRELLRLRGEVGRLRRENKEIERLREENRQLNAARVQSMPTVGTANLPGAANPMPLYTRIIKVPEALLSRMDSSSITADGNSNQNKLLQQAVRQFFQDKGIQIQFPSTLFIETNGTLLVHASLENLDKIEQILSSSGLGAQKTPVDDASVLQPVEPAK